MYAFGVVLWELYMGTRAWDGLKTSEVLNHVASKRSLVFPPSTPHRLKVVWCTGKKKGGWVPVQSVQIFGAQLHLQISAGDPDHAHQYPPLPPFQTNSGAGHEVPGLQPRRPTDIQ